MLVLISLGMTGCSSVGNKQIKNKEFISQNIAKGKTKTEVLNSLGEPTNVTYSDIGNETWLYVRNETKTRATSFIPFVGLVAGGADITTDKLYILFNSEDTVIKYTTTNVKGGAGSIFK